MRKESRQRLAKEYSYAANKMQESKEPLKKIYYFSVLFGEAQRVLNWEWDRDLALVYLLTQNAYNQVAGTLQNPSQVAVFPINWENILGQLTQITADFAAHFEKIATKNNKEELYQILGQLAEVTYSVLGNGAYLKEKGHIKA